MLKHLKGSRILVDCETDELYMDLGDGRCTPLGSSAGGKALIFTFDGDTWETTANMTFEECKTLVEAGLLCGVYTYTYEETEGGGTVLSMYRPQINHMMLYEDYFFASFGTAGGDANMILDASGARAEGGA